eukprot:Gb_18834 [translate_table: standard]
MMIINQRTSMRLFAHYKSFPTCKSKLADKTEIPEVTSTRKPEVIDDFFRNFLVKLGLNKTLDVFERLRRHFSQYEPLIRELKKKYEGIMRQKTLLSLERDRLQAQLAAVTQGSGNNEESSVRKGGHQEKSPKSGKASLKKDTGNQCADEGKICAKPDPLTIQQPHPYSGLCIETAPVKRFSLQKTLRGHSMPISNVVLHPKKPVAVTASDDSTWRMWGLPDGDLIMTGDGHKDWVAGLDFHPSGMQIASSSGDCTIKIWSFEKARCIQTFSDHTQAVWGVAYHDSGDVLASASLDHTARIWDLESMKCRGTLRGHVDSLNGIAWKLHSSIICTASSDKTISLWDARSNLCVQTFYGHQSSCNHASFDPKGTLIASVDACGIVKLWDVRKVTEFSTLDVGPHAANTCSFDRSGSILAIASSDNRVKW